ncbi:histone deacetylase family protein [Aureibacter tunicatorum]|uniref:Acetoin utilization deacetylase AcuC-like enzyme n=1 Tax=Aureibacter tunicatorum TaxID=866807 RepID=A0AAE4BSL6_9BACT|nr:histone deacetylase [Aureibacter tunicatorum]MDR6239906.1 acetoin utilization deacetylase AcuC-like enzyme [Aureibacter tunicatorum]BDD04381.1 histone deacetylase [Aureibacter tunicatorum]
MSLKVAWDECYALPLKEGHRFPMEKYPLLKEQLEYRGIVNKKDFFRPSKLPDYSNIFLAHDESYLHRLENAELSKSEIRAIGLPYDEALIEREVTIVNGTIEATKYAQDFGVSMNIAGGTHHAFTNRGEGFCVLNDQAIAAAMLMNNSRTQSIAIVDLDVHQGNGTAEIFQNNEGVRTISVHGDKNYPLRKEKSDLDVALMDDCEDETYLRIIQNDVIAYLDAIEPEFIFYQSGVDILGSDKLGKLNVSIEGCKERDKIVLEYCKNKSIPVVCCMGGGYSKDIKVILEAHTNTFALAKDIFF